MESAPKSEGGGAGQNGDKGGVSGLGESREATIRSYLSTQAVSMGMSDVSPDFPLEKRSGPHLKPSVMHDDDSPSLLMSQIISADAPLLSPSDPAWDSNSTLYSDSFTSYNFYYPSPTSTDPPSPAPRMLKSRMTPDDSSEPELCLPTNQVFTYSQLAQAQLPPSPTPSAAMSMDDRPHSSSSVSSSVAHHPFEVQSHATKRAGVTTSIVTKKPRSGERISTKDFIPPDVTGLSKREARLVKNRAAAFLSRQRKREEFENMEVYVIVIMLPPRTAD